MLSYMIAALVIAIVAAGFTIRASMEPERQKQIKVRLQIGDDNDEREALTITRMLPTAVVTILLKKVARGAEVQGEVSRGFQSEA